LTGGGGDGREAGTRRSPRAACVEERRETACDERSVLPCGGDDAEHGTTAHINKLLMIDDTLQPCDIVNFTGKKMVRMRGRRGVREALGGRMDEEKSFSQSAGCTRRAFCPPPPPFAHKIVHECALVFATGALVFAAGACSGGGLCARTGFVSGRVGWCLSRKG
jgi:hypothetical protein